MRLILAIWIALSAVAAPPLFRAQNVPAASGAFSPSDLPGLALWLDADDASTLTLSGSVVNEWRDKSGNGRDFAGSGSARPALVSAAYNGRDAIQFDGVNDVLTLGASGLGRNVGGVTVYVVMKFDALPATVRYGLFVRKGSASGGQARFTVVGGFSAANKFQSGGRRLDADSFQSVASSANAPSGTYFVAASVFDYSDSNLDQYISGALDGSSASFQTDGNSEDTDSLGAGIGAEPTGPSGFLAGAVTEILVYHAAHDAATRAAVEAYLTR